MPTSHFRVHIVSAEAEIFSGDAKMLFANGELGELGVAPGHAPLLTALAPGNIRVQLLDSEEQEVFYVSGGILEVLPTEVTVLSDTAQRASDLDEAAALEAQERAKEELAKKDADLDYSRVLTDLAQAAAQVRAVRELRKKARK